MNLSKKQHQVRLNPNEEILLRELLSAITTDQQEKLIMLDRQGREGYRNHSGAKPASKALILRRAIQLGLPQVADEMGITDA